MRHTILPVTHRSKPLYATTFRSHMQKSSTKRDRWTVKDILTWTSTYFTEKGIKTARLDAEVLLAFTLGVDRLYLYLNLDRPLSPDERALFRDYVSRRGRREPVALITGTKEFWSIQFRVAPGVLIPRPDTETLVQAVIREVERIQSPDMLEIGTGSGAVSVALAVERPDASIVALDVNRIALEVAAFNAGKARVSQSVRFLAGDLFEALRKGPAFDVICSNPPYIPTETVQCLEPEVRLFEPIEALDGGLDGLDVVRAIAKTASGFLRPGGALVLEIGDGQNMAATDILESAGFLKVLSIPDLAGKARVVRGEKCHS